MDRFQAQQEFWSSFGIPAYDARTVDYNAEMPYITYDAVSSNIGAVKDVNASLWYRSTSWAEISRKAIEISRKVYEMPPSWEIDDGRIKFRVPEVSTFAQRGSDPDPNVRKMILTVEVEFLTAY